MKKFFTLLLSAVLLASGANAQTLRGDLKADKMQKTHQSVVKSKKAKIASNHTFGHELKEGTAVLATASKADNMLGLKSNKLKKGPRKVKGGAVIYGMLSYSDDLYNMDQYGMYVASSPLASQLWSDTFDSTLKAEMGDYFDAMPGGSVYSDGVVVTWGDVTLLGLFSVGNYRCDFDVETGEIVSAELTGTRFYPSTTYCEADGYVYGMGYNADGVEGIVRSPIDDMTVTELIRPLTTYDILLTGICYNSGDNHFYGINAYGELVKFDSKFADYEILRTAAQLGVPNFYPYYGALCYDEYDNTIYWNAQTSVGAKLVMIDASSYAARTLFDYEAGDEYSSMCAKPRDVSAAAPAAGRLVSVNVEGLANHGEVVYTLPSTAVNGSKLEGSLEWVLKVNGEECNKGAAAPGETVTIPLYALEQGENIIRVYAKNTAGELGAAATGSVWVGNDVPSAPKNVTLSATQISWDAVTTGAHNGYIDPAEVTYQAYLNGTALGLPTKETSVAVDINTTGSLKAYEATVVAYFADNESEAASSNKLIEGDPLTMPATIYPTAEQWNVCQTTSSTTVGWKFGDPGIDSDCIYIGYDENNQLDAWVFLPAVEISDLSHFVELKADICAFSEKYPLEWLDIAYGSEAKPEAMNMIVSDFQPAYGTPETYTFNFKPAKAGVYYIGFHATSDPDMFGMLIQNIKLQASPLTDESPAAVAGLEVTPAANGVLSADVTFTMPTKNLGNKALSDDTVITALVKGETFTTVYGKPGERINCSVATVQSHEGQESTVTVVTSVGDLPGLSVTSEEFWAGVELPEEPVLTSYETSADNMSVTFTWEPVEGDNVTYLVARYQETFLGADYFLLEEVSDTSYTFTLPAGSPQSFEQLGVAASNVAGSSYLSVFGCSIGAPQYLPITLDLAAATETDPFTGVDPILIGGNSNWFILPAASLFEDEVDVPGYVVANYGTEENEETFIEFPKFSTKGLDLAATSLTVYQDDFGTCPEISVVAYTYDIEDTVIATYNNHAGEGFITQNFRLPEQFQNQPWVGVKLVVKYTDPDNQLLVLRGWSANTRRNAESGINNVEALSAKLISGGKGVINFSNLNGENAVVTRLDGARVANKTLNGDKASISVDKGIYVVKAGDKKQKVIVK